MTVSRSDLGASWVVCEWLRRWGFVDAGVTVPGSVGGIDVLGADVAAQVRVDVRPCTDMDLRSLVVAAGLVRGARLCFFSSGGFTRDAVRYATDVEMGLFEFDLQGEPRAVNVAGSRLADAGVWSLEVGIFSTLELLPAEWLDPIVPRAAPLPASWRSLAWGSVTLGSTDADVLVALARHRDVEPRPQLQFGDRLVGAGDAWLAFEVPAPPGKELYAVQVTPLPIGRQRFDLTRYGARPPIGAFCTSLDAVLRYSAPWRSAARTDGRFELMVSA